MGLSRKNRVLYMDKEALCALDMCAQGFLKPVDRLMGEEEAKEVDLTGLYHGFSFPFSFVLAPGGQKNHDVLASTSKGEVLDLICDQKVYGSICVEEAFAIDKERRFKKIMAGDLASKRSKYIYQRLGNYAVSGEYHLEPVMDVSNIKSTIQERKKSLNAKKVTALILQANPIHRVHERIIRLAYDESDLLVIFLLKPYNDDSMIPYSLRVKLMKFLVNNYFSRDKLLVIPFEDTYLSSGANRMILDAIMMQNVGCTRIVTGRTHMGLSLYYENNKVHTVFDQLKGIHIDIHVLSEYVYCLRCGAIVSITSCPHGQHHHIHYRTKSLLELLALGIPPPPLLMRKEVTAMVLNQLYPDRVRHIEKLYHDIIPSSGILEKCNNEKFYLELIKLYQTPL